MLFLYNTRSSATVNCNKEPTLGWRCSVVVSALASINVVNRHWARLVLEWVTACRWVNHLGM